MTNSQSTQHWIPFQIGSRSCPAKNFSLEILHKLALKIVTELQLSFDGYVDDIVLISPLHEIKYFGLVLTHHHPFNLRVDLKPDEMVLPPEVQRRKKSIVKSVVRTWQKYRKTSLIPN